MKLILDSDSLPNITTVMSETKLEILDDKLNSSNGINEENEDKDSNSPIKDKTIHMEEDKENVAESSIQEQNGDDSKNNNEIERVENGTDTTVVENDDIKQKDDETSAKTKAMETAKEDLSEKEQNTNCKDDTNMKNDTDLVNGDTLGKESLDNIVCEDEMAVDKEDNSNIVEVINDCEEIKDDNIKETVHILDKKDELMTNKTKDVIKEEVEMATKNVEKEVMERKADDDKKEVSCLNNENKQTIEINTESEEDIPMEENVKANNTETNDSDVVNLEESSSSMDCDGEPEKQKSDDVIDHCVNSQETIELTGFDDSKTDEDDVTEVEKNKKEVNVTMKEEQLSEKKETVTSPKPSVLKLSNTLDILSDDEDSPMNDETVKNEVKEEKAGSKPCINIIEDDDDIMLIDDDTSTDCKEKSEEMGDITKTENETESSENKLTTKTESNKTDTKDHDVELDLEPIKDETITESPKSPNEESDEPVIDKTLTSEKEPAKTYKPLVQENFLQTCKKNLTDMTRDDLEELCILKIVESIVDRSNLGEIKMKLKTMAQTIEEFKKKTLMLTKQNRDLQVVLKSVQEEQKKMTDLPITPLKITRSVGMQVLMSDAGAFRRKTPNTASNNKTARSTGNQSQQSKPPSRPPSNNNNNQQIPVPRLVPAVPGTKTPPQSSNSNTPVKANPQTPNGVRNTSAQKTAEKRPNTRMSVTVDLTDDEPPTKAARVIHPPVRLVSQQNLMANPRPHYQPNPTQNSNLRKVYIPISGPQNATTRANSPQFLKTVSPTSSVRPRSILRMPQNAISRPSSARHPAPLPETVKQYQRPNWKALPPAPDLKLSKVENGIVISWKIEGYQEDSYEEIASYQLFAYQETHISPSTSLWKKIGDVKALPLPMACTLTQFMAGFKYYFAVRAVDVKSRLGPFSLPGSILLLNKV